MDRYFEIKLIQDTEISSHQVLAAVFMKLHCILYQRTEGRVGISFPEYGRFLGNTMRLHGTQQDLGKIIQCDWLGGVKGYTRISDIMNVPENAKYCTFRRIQVKSPENKRKRSLAKGGVLTMDAAIQRFPESSRKHIDLPFLQIKSFSNGNSMKIWIEKGKISDIPKHGVFSSYGLSRFATVPLF